MEYAEIEKLMGEETMLAGKNEHDENVVLVRVGDRIKVTTSQSNGWLRINIYHKDGTVEELYDK